MVEPGEDFDEVGDDEPRGQLLPPEDRLWRHPSELAAASPPAEQVMLARRRWLQATPTRSGAGAAGVVGAILATGVVLVGTHLTAWLSAPATPHVATEAAIGITSASGPVTTVAAVAPVGLGAVINGVTRAVVTVRSVKRQKSVATSGVIVSSNGYVLVPAEAASGATSISVVRSDGEELLATVAGVDASTGLAVLHVDERGLPTLRFEGRGRDAGTFLLDVWKDDTASDTVQIRLARSSGRPLATSLDDGPALLQDCQGSLGLANAPDGAIVIDGTGDIQDIVTAHKGAQPVCASGWLANWVSAKLRSSGRITHGWLGISGQATETPAPTPSIRVAGIDNAARDEPMVPGVRVTWLSPSGAAALAGLERGDVIEKVNGHPVASMPALQADLYLMAPSAPVTLGVVHDDQLSEVSTRLRPAA